MIEDKNHIQYQMSDSAILATLGEFIRQIRLAQNKTQLDVATAAGIKRMTLVRIEQGRGGTMGTFIRLLRSLQQFHALKSFQPASQISPLSLAKLERKKRQRARPKKVLDKKKQSDW